MSKKKNKKNKKEPEIRLGNKNIRAKEENMWGYNVTNGAPSLTTDIDKLLEMVKKEKFIRVSVAAKRFGVSQKTIKDWGEILEDHRLLQLHYPLFGEPVLRLKPSKRMGDKKGNKNVGKNKKTKKHKSSKRCVLAIILIAAIGIIMYYGLVVNPGFITTLATNPILIVSLVIIIIIMASILRFKKKKSIKPEKKKGKK